VAELVGREDGQQGRREPEALNREDSQAGRHLPVAEIRHEGEPVDAPTNVVVTNVNRKSRMWSQ